MTFRVGQKVVCVLRSIHPSAIVHPGLVINKVYTVTDVLMEPYWKSPGLLLAEICPRPEYCSFESLMFRPLVSRKTDISALKALLVPGAKILEDA